MDSTEIAYLRGWIGKTADDEDLIALRQAHLMAATIDWPETRQLAEGFPLPPLWHWLYFLEGLPPDKLGRDGHPARGDFLPPVPLPNRLWAGGRLAFLADVPIGTRVRKHSRIKQVEYKRGRSGDLVFVTVQHEIQAIDGQALIHEEQDIVYKSASRSEPRDEPAATTAPAISRSFCPTATTLFRYSALTFNGHRIHYDLDYCRQNEGYDNLVIHGPLIATLLAGLASAQSSKGLHTFSYRALSPALLGETITLTAALAGERALLTATRNNGLRAMEAEALLAG